MSTDRDAEREQLAAALAGIPVRVDAAGAIDIQQAEVLADALLPVVDRIANERAAAELRAIGRAGLAATPGAHPVRVPVGYLFERADALDPK